MSRTIPRRQRSVAALLAVLLAIMAGLGSGAKPVSADYGEQRLCGYLNLNSIAMESEVQLFILESEPLQGLEKQAIGLSVVRKIALALAAHPDVKYPSSMSEVVSASLFLDVDTILARAMELDEANDLGCFDSESPHKDDPPKDDHDKGDHDRDDHERDDPNRDNPHKADRDRDDANRDNPGRAVRDQREHGKGDRVEIGLAGMEDPNMVHSATWADARRIADDLPDAE
jgi:hypothetical protein